VATVLAAEAGKDIYVEKPVSLRIAETRAMVEAVRRHGRICQVGLQQRSAPEFRLATQLVRDGALGRIRRIYTIHNNVSGDVDLPAEPTPERSTGTAGLAPPLAPVQSPSALPGQTAQRGAVEFVRDFGGAGSPAARSCAGRRPMGAGMDASGPREIVARRVSGPVRHVSL